MQGISQTAILPLKYKPRLLYTSSGLTDKRLLQKIFFIINMDITWEYSDIV